MASFARRHLVLYLVGSLVGLGAAAAPRTKQPAPALPTPGQTPAPPPAAAVRIPRVKRPPKLDDFLNSAPREAEAVVTGFTQYEPGDGIPLSQPTTAYLSYDEKNLYVVFVCRDDRDKIRARMAKREDVSSDDAVGIYLDTFHDHQRAYYFYVNPLGIQTDGIETEGQGGDTSFDTLWYSEGRVTPEGYVAWIAIPFKSLRFPNAWSQTWGVALTRTIVRNNEVSYWPYVTKRIEGLVPQFAILEGLEGISPGRNLQLIPYTLFARARFLDQVDPNNPRFRTENEWRGGVDAKFVVRDALTFDFTANPDFSQVESDEPQVTINQRFEVFFPEKRPFFIENAGFFQTPVNLFFSRRVADPQFGSRMTGKLGRWALGALLIDDRGPGKGRLASDPLNDERAGIGVVRVQREFGRQSRIGALFASRDFAASSNRAVSLDLRLKLSQNWVLSGQYIRSYTHALDGTKQAGPASWAELLYSGRHLSYTGHFYDVSPDFHTDLGFVPRVDVRQTDHFAGYFWRPEESRIIAFGPVASALVNWSHAGAVQDWNASLGFQMVFPRQTVLQISRGEAFELFQGIGFRKHSTAAQLDAEWLRWLTLSARYAQGTLENYFPNPSLLPFLGASQKLSFGFTLRPTPRFRWDQTYLYTRLGTLDGATPPGATPGSSIFNNHVLRTKLNYQFTRELSLRAIFDYNATLANPDLVDVQTTLRGFPDVTLLPTKRFTPDILLTYLLHPGTAIHLGYTNRYDNLDLIPGIPPSLAFSRSPTTSTGRQVFIKVSYLLRF